MSRSARTTSALDATSEQLEATDAGSVLQPIEQPYGVRDCAVPDRVDAVTCADELR